MRTFLLLLSVILLTHISFAQADSAGKYFNSFDNTKICYEIKGEGEPVILVHGFMNTADTWKKTALYSALLNAGFKVITPDLRGNGRSDKPHSDEGYANDAEAKDVMQLASLLHLKNYDVVGYSRGSIITSRLLVLDDRINKAVIGGMGADFTDPEWPRRKMFARALMGDTVKELEGMIKYVKESGLDQQALAYQQRQQPSTSKEELAKIKIPVLVVCGKEDDANGSGEELTKLVPGAKFTTVPGDHGAAMRTKEFAEAVVRFLK